MLREGGKNMENHWNSLNTMCGEKSLSDSDDPYKFKVKFAEKLLAFGI